MADDRDSYLRSVYGDGYESPALTNMRAGEEVAPTYSTSDLNKAWPQEPKLNPIARALRAIGILAETPNPFRVATDDNEVARRLAMAGDRATGMMGSAADTTRHWLNWKPQVGPDTLAPFGLAAMNPMGRMASAATRGVETAPARAAPQLQSAVHIGGETFTGPTHFHALENAQKQLGADFDRLLGSAKEGFVGPGGHFLDDQKEISRMFLSDQQRGSLPGTVINGLEQGAPRIDNPIRAYHGSPHDFDQFSMSKIGTGEGAQAYGHGLYFAESEPVARFYKEALSQKPSVSGQPLLDQKYNTANSTGHPYLDHAIREAFGDLELTRQTLQANIKSGPSSDLPYWQKVWKERVSNSQSALDALAELEKSGALGQVSPGKMYEVALHARPEQFLDWDKPLAGQPLVQEKIRPLMRGDFPGVTGEGAHRDVAVQHTLNKGLPPNLAPREEIAQVLREAGIPGIRYLDQGSRGAGAGTSNYVVWTPEIIEILKKYGLAGAAPVGGALATDLLRREYGDPVE